MSEPTDPNAAKPVSTDTPSAPPPPPQEFDLLAFWIQYRSLIIRSFLLFAVILAAVFGYRLFQHLKQTNSQNALASAKTVEEFRKVAADYEGTHAAASALLRAAEALRASDKQAE